jgi:alpha-tubulin suppressor-like RCC1 family protein
MSIRTMPIALCAAALALALASCVNEPSSPTLDGGGETDQPDSDGFDDVPLDAPDAPPDTPPTDDGALDEAGPDTTEDGPDRDGDEDGEDDEGSVPAPIVDISAGGNHTCVILEGGGVKCWGFNNVGQLGNGTHGDLQTSPVDVVGLGGAAVVIDGGGNHTCAVLASGGLQCWGGNSEGCLGDGTVRVRPNPIDVPGLSSGVASVTAGGAHTCALLDSGAVKCWGRNQHGQLGIGSTTDSYVPVDVPDLRSGVAAVSAGGNHTCALLDSGGVKCWGWNDNGDLGDGTTVMKSSPVDVVGLPSAAVALVAGSDGACARLDTGGLACWGYGLHGDLGDGTRTSSSIPVPVDGLSSGVDGFSTSCAVVDGGALRCWGLNEDGQCGDGTAIERDRPVDVVGLPEPATAVVSGYWHSCARLASGAVWCWGNNRYGDLGDGTLDMRPLPEPVAGVSGAASIVAGATAHTCALAGGELQCWGNNDFGQLGDGTRSSSRVPIAVALLPDSPVGLSVGGQHSCAVLSGGGASCWGANRYGQLGDGTTTDSLSPVPVAGLPGTVAQVGAGWRHTCARTATGEVLCWGINSQGELGNGTLIDSPWPTPVTGLPAGAMRLAVGMGHSCALGGDDTVRCWGYNAQGQLGTGGTADSDVPVAVVGLPAGVADLVAGELHTCVVLDSGEVYCWGSNYEGQLGNGEFETTHTTPIAMLGLPGAVRGIAAGASHSCALLATGGVYCTGTNSRGQLGTGSPSIEVLPVEVPGLSGVAVLVAGDEHTCAASATGEVFCWGADEYGQASGDFHGYPHAVVSLAAP